MSELRNIQINEISADPHNPRERFPQEELDKLAESIDQVGVLVPVVVYEYEGSFRLLDGERRWRCCQILGKENIPAVIVGEPSEEDRLTQMFNIHLVREQWQDMPTAKALSKLMKETGVESASTLSNMTGLSTNQINRYLFALDLPDFIQKVVNDGDVPLNYFYEVSKAIIRPLEKKRPQLFQEYGAEEILARFLAKRISGAIPDIVSVRDAQFIIRKAAEDDPDRHTQGPLDLTLKQLIEDDNLSVKDAYENTVMVAVEVDKLEQRADGIVTAFRRLLSKADDKNETEVIYEIGRKLINNLSEVIDV